MGGIPLTVIFSREERAYQGKVGNGFGKGEGKMNIHHYLSRGVGEYAIMKEGEFMTSIHHWKGAITA